jgi:hypothetical protein
MKKIKTILIYSILISGLFLTAGTSSQGVFTFCKNVDDNVYPIEAVSEISTGTPVYFHFAMINPIGKEGDNNITVGWIIHTVGEDGMDSGFIDEYFTYFQPGYRRFCTDQPFYFSSPGKYRVYAISWDDRQLNHHTGNLTKYHAKNEITVK